MEFEENLKGRADKNFSKMGKKSKKEKKEKKPAVGVFGMFRYADWLDKLCMILGTLAAIIHGTLLPLLMLVFGNMTDSFTKAEASILPSITNQSGPNSTLIISNSSLEEEMAMLFCTLFFH